MEPTYVPPTPANINPPSTDSSSPQKGSLAGRIFHVVKWIPPFTVITLIVLLVKKIWSGLSNLISKKDGSSTVQGNGVPPPPPPTSTSTNGAPLPPPLQNPDDSPDGPKMKPPPLFLGLAKSSSSNTTAPSGKPASFLDAIQGFKKGKLKKVNSDSNEDKNSNPSTGSSSNPSSQGKTRGASQGNRKPEHFDLLKAALAKQRKKVSDPSDKTPPKLRSSQSSPSLRPETELQKRLRLRREKEEAKEKQKSEKDSNPNPPLNLRKTQSSYGFTGVPTKTTGAKPRTDWRRKALEQKRANSEKNSTLQQATHPPKENELLKKLRLRREKSENKRGT